jgi:hypothetical protein
MASLWIQFLKLYFKVNPLIFAPVGGGVQKIKAKQMFNFYEQDLYIVFE